MGKWLNEILSTSDRTDFTKTDMFRNDHLLDFIYAHPVFHLVAMVSVYFKIRNGHLFHGTF